MGFNSASKGLITHEEILLNGDVPRRNGNVTYRVNSNLHKTETQN